MPEQDQKSAGQNPAGDDLDYMLDAVLAKYAAVEPRAGLEERVLASLRSERANVPARAWRRWGLAAALAAVVVIALALAFRPTRPSRRVIVNQVPVVAPNPREPEKQFANRAANADRLRGHELAKRSGRGLRPTQTKVAAAPKLDQFPSPQPLSEQEKLLAEYVGSYHEEAVLIARARAQQLRQDRMEEDADDAEQGYGRSEQRTDRP
jgi:hypothetical protein